MAKQSLLITLIDIYWLDRAPYMSAFRSGGSVAYLSSYASIKEKIHCAYQSRVLRSVIFQPYVFFCLSRALLGYIWLEAQRLPGDHLALVAPDSEWLGGVVQCA